MLLKTIAFYVLLSVGIMSSLYCFYDSLKKGLVFSFNELLSSEHERYWGTPLQVFLCGVAGIVMCAVLVLMFYNVI